MSRTGRSQAGTWLLCVGLCAGAAALAFAQAEKQVVYWPLVTDGTEYRRVSYPQEAGPLVVLADTEIAIEARLAPVSYWPISREYLADLSGEPELPQGSLELVDASGEVSLVKPEPYVLWYPAGAAAGPSELVHGERAHAFYEDYVGRARAAAERLKEYQRVVAEHGRLVEAWLAMAAERRGENVPPPPPELDIDAPELYQSFATEPQQAVVLSLPVGSYTVQLRGVDGEIVPGSRRTLESFGPLGQGVGYVLRQENRWTQPVVSFAPDEIIYTTGGTDLFFQPAPVVEYPAQRFARLFRPQSVEAADPSLTVWVPRKDTGGADESTALAVWDGADMVEAVPRKNYRVNQLADSARGYSIDEFVPQPGASLEPDLTAMRVEANNAATKVSLVRGAGGDQVEASERAVKLLDPPAEPLLFLPALLPLAVGLALRAGSARRKRAAA